MLAVVSFSSGYLEITFKLVEVVKAKFLFSGLNSVEERQGSLCSCCCCFICSDRVFGKDG